MNLLSLMCLALAYYSLPQDLVDVDIGDLDVELQ
jgi:hypothetical protein